ncbi:MAG TPA: hypothetical protein VF103_01680, partial [Polyangiaceae bacterium]
ELVAAALDVFGYTALLVCDLASGENRSPRLHLLVAAVRTTRASLPDASGASRAALARCRELGFDVSFTDAGLLGRANEATRALVKKSPAALHAVAPVVTSMARAAYELGAVPAA